MNDLTTESVVLDSVFRVGSVEAVRGRQIEIKVDKTKNGSHLLYKGDVLKNVSVGGYLKIAKGFTDIIVKVDEERIQEDRTSDSGYSPKAARVTRILVVSLIGFFKLDGSFERGVKELPLVHNVCFLLTRDEFNRVHNFVGDEDQPLRIGTLALEKGQSIAFGVNSIMASHIGIFGNTGSGKSYTLARLYHEIFAQYKDNVGFKANAQFLLIDFNGEYVDVSGTGKSSAVIVEASYKTMYRLDTSSDTGDKIPIKTAVINNSDFWSVALQATEATQKPFLARALEHDFWETRLASEDVLKAELKRMILAVTKDYDPSLERTMVHNFVHDLSQCFDGYGAHGLDTLRNDYRTNLEFHGSGNNHYYYKTGTASVYSDKPNFKTLYVDAKVDALSLDVGALSIIDRIRLKIMLQYYDDVLKKFANREHIAPLIKRLEKRVRDLKRTVKLGASVFDGKNLVVISLKDVNLDMKKILPLLVAKQLYDEKKKDNHKDKFLNIIVDEAHNILSLASARETEQWREYRLETFEEIIKEGRKFGVFLTIASQRPHDISPTIISQLHNYFLHRLINELDIQAIRHTVSYLDKVNFESLSILPTGTAVFAGLTAHVPVVVSLSRMDARFAPNSSTMEPAKHW